MQQSLVQFTILIALPALAGCLGLSTSMAQEKQAIGRGGMAPRDQHACPPHRGGNIPRPGSRDATPAEKTAFLEMLRKSPTGRTIVDQFSISVAQVAAKRQNITRYSHDPQHGNQVTFSTADGHTFLWYPGNSIVLKGEWRACEDRFGITQRGETTTVPFGKICFKYGANTFNPATGAAGNTWECAAASKLEATLVDQRPGDIFGLAKKAAVPFVLPRDKMSINELLARLQKAK